MIYLAAMTNNYLQRMLILEKKEIAWGKWEGQ